MVGSSHIVLRKVTKAKLEINKYNECNEWGFRPPFCTYRLNWARRIEITKHLSISKDRIAFVTMLLLV